MASWPLQVSWDVFSKAQQAAAQLLRHGSLRGRRATRATLLGPGLGSGPRGKDTKRLASKWI